MRQITHTQIVLIKLKNHMEKTGATASSISRDILRENKDIKMSHTNIQNFLTKGRCSTTTLDLIERYLK